MEDQFSDHFRRGLSRSSAIFGTCASSSVHSEETDGENALSSNDGVVVLDASTLTFLRLMEIHQDLMPLIADSRFLPVGGRLNG